MPHVIKPSLLVFIFALLSFDTAKAYDIDLGPLGHACDTCGGGVIGGLPVIGKPLNEIIAQTGGSGLEQWLIQSRNDAINGSMPVPLHIRQQLSGYASEDSLNRARYKSGDNGLLNTAHVLEQSMGDVKAVTLIDVIVFRGPSEANDPALWAHELVHIDQYRDWGVHDFSIRYTRNAGEVEAPAYAKGNDFYAWRSTQNSIPTIPNNPSILMGNFCNTPIGKFGPGSIGPVGLQCWVQTPNGIVYGQMSQ